MTDSLDLSAVGRSVLIAMVTDLRARLVEVNAYLRENLANGKIGDREYQAMFDNLTATQARCTELLEENRELKRWMPGWFCPKCAVFNGEVKEPLPVCRSCGGPRP